MLRRLAILDTLTRTGALLIVRVGSADEALRVAHAAVAGGIRALEIPLSVPGALRVIGDLAAEYEDVAVGAGTVLDAQAAYACVTAGARFLVSPNLNPDMIRTANRYQVPTISGALTPTEIVATLEAGADLVKLFPAELGGPAYLKSVLAPLPQAAVVPTGGVNPDNVAEWYAAGAAAVGVGSFVTAAARADGDYGRVTRAAKQFLAAIAAARPEEAAHVPAHLR